jgi:hypothetical protein
MKFLLIIVVLATAGCAAPGPATENGCVQRTAVLHEIQPNRYVATQRCTAWVLGPSLSQRADWYRRFGSRDSVPK